VIDKKNSTYFVSTEALAVKDEEVSYDDRNFITFLFSYCGQKKRELKPSCH